MLRQIGFACALALCVSGVEAQTLDGKEALRSQQQDLFDQLFERPDNLDVMFEYAAVSAQLEDFEAAIATLERMLTYNQSLPRVRLELGAMYFNIGSYRVAESYFNAVNADPSTPDPVREKVGAYLAEIAKRTSRSSISGQVAAGFITSTNANSGPDDASVLLAGVPATLLRGVEEGDNGVVVRASATHIYDLQRQNDDLWRTDAGGSLRVFEDLTEGNLLALFARTGPRLSLADEQYGPKIRPFVDGEYVGYGNSPLYFGYGAGAEYANTLSDLWFAYGEARIGYRDFRAPRDGSDAFTGSASVGAAYTPTRDLVLRAGLGLTRELADDDFESSASGSLRLSFAYQYDIGLPSIRRKWQLDGFAEGTLRAFDDPDPIVDPTQERLDREIRLGLGHTYYLPGDAAFVRAEGSARWRNANIPNYDLTAYDIQLLVGVDF